MLSLLFPPKEERWWVRFGVMMALSVVIAVMGLSADSAALVIGSMVIAPLMTPVLALAAALALTLGRHAARAALTIIIATGGAVCLAWAIGSLLPGSERILTNQALSRTSPDLRDLIVAFAAGAAGAYATVREDISTALPGVAVAVALVPPLATVGYTLAAHRPDLAGGALLLFAANLLAIVLVGLVVFLITGLTPRRRLAQRSGGILAGLVVLAAAVVAVAIPLGQRSVDAIRHAHRLQAINTAVVAWVDTASLNSLTLTGVQVSGQQVTVDVAGPQSPPNDEPLRQALIAYLGPGAAVRVRWFQT